MTSVTNFLVAQLGARRHYAIPRMLQEAGMLSHFYTDICAVKGWPRALNLLPDGLRTAGVKRLLGRVPVGVPSDKITALTLFGWEYYRRRASARTVYELTKTDLWAGRHFCELVFAKGLNGAEGVYTFNNAGLELLTQARKRGLSTVMEQTIAPRQIEIDLLMAEQERFPEWEPPIQKNEALGEFMAREQAEWEQADVILCGSEFVRDGIAASGGPAEKCRVVPYGVDVKFKFEERTWHAGPLRVLTVGAVGLRKGSPYVLEAARQLKGVAEFRMVGSVGVLPAARSRLAETVELLGAVPRSEIRRHFAWADVFLLPSLCEGSATVVYEALAAGVPVICTPNTGSIVQDGVDGFIVPMRDTQAIVERLVMLADSPDMLSGMQDRVHRNLNNVLLNEYGIRLTNTIGNLSNDVQNSELERDLCGRANTRF